MTELRIFIPVTGLNNQEYDNFYKAKFEAAAQGIYNSLDKNLQNKYSTKDIYKYMLEIDSNKDGVFTMEEMKTFGKDKDNIFRMNANTTSEDRRYMETKIAEEQELCGIKGIEKGLSAPWGIAKIFVYKNTTKDGLKEMFTDSVSVRNYFNTRIANDKNKMEHMTDLIRHHRFSEQELTEMGFDRNQIDQFLNKS